MTDQTRGSHSGRVAQTLLLPDVPEHAVIHRAGLVVVSTDKTIRGWTGDRGNLSSPLEPHLIGLEPGRKVMWFRIKPEDSSPIKIGEVQWLRTVWPNVPADVGNIEYLLIKAIALGGYEVPGMSSGSVPTNNNGTWYRMKLEDLQSVGKIAALEGRRLWAVKVDLLSTGDRSTTVELLTRKVA